MKIADPTQSALDRVRRLRRDVRRARPIRVPELTQELIDLERLLERLPATPKQGDRPS